MSKSTMMILERPEWIEQLAFFVFISAEASRLIGQRCQVRRREIFQVCKGVRSQRALTKRNLISPLEKCCLPLDVEMIDQLSTLQVLCRGAQWIRRRQFLQRMSITVLIWTACWVNHCNIAVSSVMFLSPTEQAAPWNVSFEVTDTKRATLSVHKGCGNGSLIVFTPDGKATIINDTRCIEHVQQILVDQPRIRHCV